MEKSDGVCVAVLGKSGGIGLLLIGIAFVVAAVSFLLRSTAAPAPAALTGAPSHQTQQAHDFQLIQLGDMRRDQFLLDKRTGHVWDSVCSGQVSGADCNGTIVWQEMHVDGVAPATTAAAEISFEQATQGLN